MQLDPVVALATLVDHRLSKLYPFGVSLPISTDPCTHSPPTHPRTLPHTDADTPVSAWSIAATPKIYAGVSSRRETSTRYVTVTPTGVTLR